MDNRPTLQDVLIATQMALGVTIADLKSPKRHARIAKVRQLAMATARQHTGASYPRIGRAFGFRDHTTAMFAIRASNSRIAIDPRWRAKQMQIELAFSAAKIHRLRAFNA